MTKYIFVTGGVTSSLGKGIFAASLAKILQEHGFEVTIQKFDPYLNIDPGTLNPYEHGECYVTEDGAETDLDLGHYERFLNTPTSQANNVTTGRVYQTVLDRERKGDFLGKTVQVIPHITDEIKRRFSAPNKEKKRDFILTELGGTVGDIESLPYIEAVRQFIWDMGKENAIVCHLTLVPYLSAAKELKTKPTQHSVKMLLESGIQPDILICRTEHELSKEIRKKLALFCNVEESAVIQAIDKDTIYDVPLELQRENIDKVVLKKLKMKSKKEPKLEKWNKFLDKLKHPKQEVNIALVGKYIELQDAYKSIYESFIHAGAAKSTKVNVVAVHSKSITAENAKEILGKFHGVLVAPGFGERAITGKIETIRYVRENKIPFFGICLGMQMCVVEFARNVLNMKDAHSIEINKNTKYPVIDIMESQKTRIAMGGTMRLGSYECSIKDKKSLAYKIYKTSTIYERHRHRYEFNNDYLEAINKFGLKSTGKNPDTGLVEIVELEGHPFFIGVQYHPELKSTPENPHPLFIGLVEAALERKGKK
jgi:CTP synthase